MSEQANNGAKSDSGTSIKNDARSGETTSSREIWDGIVVGAGISGLAARAELLAAGFRVLTLEKSRGLGGRAATRRGEGWRADLGAQHVSARDPEWRAHLDSPESGMTRLVDRTASPHPRWVHPEGMSRLAASLVKRAPAPPGVANEGILTATRVLRIEAAETDGARVWRVPCQTGSLSEAEYRCRVLVLAIPVPQVELLLKTSGLLPEKSRSGTGAGVSVSDRLAWVSDTLYHPCLTGVFVLEPAVGALGGLPPALPPLLRDPTPELSGIFDQRKKGLVGGSGGSAEVLVVQAAPGWSTENFGFSESEVLPALWELACGVLARDYGMSERPRLRQSLLHRWRYCEPVRALPHEFGEVFPSQDAADFPPLLVCGDAFGPPRMETAYVSGRAAGRAAGQAAGKAVGHAGSLIG